MMTSFLAILAIMGFGVVAWRWRDIPSVPMSDKLLSRDSFFSLMILVVMLMAGIVALASMPVISAIPVLAKNYKDFLVPCSNWMMALRIIAPEPFQDGRFGLIGSFYSTTIAPLGLILAALMIICPLLGWRDSNARQLFAHDSLARNCSGDCDLRRCGVGGADVFGGRLFGDCRPLR
jgi:cytochrome c-type biogenesis protein CcmF